MSLLLDHNVPAKFARLLRDWGYEASRLAEHLAPDTEDVDVIALAQTLDAVLLTLDYPPHDYVGIVVLRYQTPTESAVIATLRQALDDLYRDDTGRTGDRRTHPLPHSQIAHP